MTKLLAIISVVGGRRWKVLERLDAIVQVEKLILNYSLMLFIRFTTAELVLSLDFGQNAIIDVVGRGLPRAECVCCGSCVWEKFEWGRGPISKAVECQWLLWKHNMVVLFWIESDVWRGGRLVVLLNCPCAAQVIDLEHGWLVYCSHSLEQILVAGLGRHRHWVHICAALTE